MGFETPPPNYGEQPKVDVEGKGKEYIESLIEGDKVKQEAGRRQLYEGRPLEKDAEKPVIDLKKPSMIDYRNQPKVDIEARKKANMDKWLKGSRPEKSN